jgi:hypothetical protein
MKQMIKKWRLVLVTVLSGLLILLTALPTVAVGPGDPDTAITVSDAHLNVGGIATSDVVVSIVQEGESDAELLGVEVHLQFDPSVVQVVDFDGDPTNGTQLEVRTELFDGDVQIGVNAADNAAGTIVFAITQLGGTGTPLLNASGPVATIHWTGVARGTSVVAVTDRSRLSDPEGYEIAIDSASGCTVTVERQGVGWITGTVKLQGRYDHSGALVSALLWDPACCHAYTDVEGNFTIAIDEPGFYTVSAWKYGYLRARRMFVSVQTGQTTHVGTVMLLGGDVIVDNVVDICDVTYIAARFLGTSYTADVTGDGKVDILDLTVTAANFGTVGPILW